MSHEALLTDAYDAYERQITETLYGGGKDSTWCDDQVWRELDHEIQKRLWQGNLVNTDHICLVDQRSMMQQTGIVNGREVAQEDLHEIDEVIHGLETRLNSLRKQRIY